MSILTYKEQVQKFMEVIQGADAILIGAGSGMSAAAGFRHYYERDDTFIKHLGDFEKKYGFHCSFDGFYYRYQNTRQRWAYIARWLHCILNAETGSVYKDIYDILKDKNYHILTTNQDTQFSRLFPEEKISAIQGDDRYFQCSRPCHDEIYPASEIIHKLNQAIDDNLEVPSDMIPHCPKCGVEMEPWVRSYVFLEGAKYKEEHEKVKNFINENKHKKILFLELGVGRMTPMFIQEPFWNLTYQLPQAFYITINPKHAILPKELENKGIAIHEDIAKVLRDTKAELEQRSFLNEL